MTATPRLSLTATDEVRTILQLAGLPDNPARFVALVEKDRP